MHVLNSMLNMKSKLFIKRKLLEFGEVTNVSICTWFTCCGCFVNILLYVITVFQQVVVALCVPLVYLVLCEMEFVVFSVSFPWGCFWGTTQLNTDSFLVTWFLVHLIFALWGITATIYFIYSLDFSFVS